MHAIRVQQIGGPEQLVYQEVETPKPGSGQALVKIEAVGVNYIDIYHRTGLYKLNLPFTPGSEAAGTIESVGEGVTEFKPGDRVAYASQPNSYAEYNVVSASQLVPVPDGMTTRQAAAAMLQGMTAHYLIYGSYPLKSGDRTLIHAAAGGVGLLFVQMAKMIGATVYGTVSTEEKAALVREAGADEVIIYTQQDFESEVKRLTGGKGLDVVYDSVGKTTFDKSLNCLRPRGYMVLFGQSSGPVPPFDPSILNAKGSLFLTRPKLGDYTLTREELLQRAGDVLNWIQEGKLKLRIEHTFPLAEAAEAHRQLESRATTGKVLLIP